MIASLKRVMVSVENEIARLTESAQAVKQKANEVMQFIRSVLSSDGTLQIPVQTGKYVRRISNREALRKPENIETFLSSHDIDTFAGLQDYADAAEKALPKTEKSRNI